MEQELHHVRFGKDVLDYDIKGTDNRRENKQTGLHEN